MRNKQVCIVVLLGSILLSFTSFSISAYAESGTTEVGVRLTTPSTIDSSDKLSNDSKEQRVVEGKKNDSRLPKTGSESSIHYAGIGGICLAIAGSLFFIKDKRGDDE